MPAYRFTVESAGATVAEGVQFDDGVCVLHHAGDMPPTWIYADLGILLAAIPARFGTASIEWLDRPGIEEG